jgi:Zn-dependent protease with chaperone function
MISLQQLMLVLITLGCRQWADAEPAIKPLTAGLAISGIALGFGLLFKMTALRAWSVSASRWQAGAQHAGDSASVRERCTQARAVIEAMWVACLPLTLLGTGWGSLLENLQSAGLPQALIIVAWFAPSCLWLALMELTAAQLDELYTTSTAGQTHQPLENDLKWPQQWLLRMRLGAMASLVTCITPVLLIVAVTDGISYWTDESLAPQLLLGATLLTLAGGVLFLPCWMGQWMGVVDFPEGALRSLIESYMRELKIRGVALRLLPSHGRLPGAAIVGWFPRFRQLWLGDALLARLTPEQLDMVVMHELAHVSRKHYLWRLLPIVGALVVVGLFGLLWPQPPDSTTGNAGDSNLTASLVASAVASIVMLAGVSFMAHRCELDADRTACLLAQRSCGWVAGEPSRAAVALAEALHQLLHDCPAASKTTWLHPSLTTRHHHLSRWRKKSN